jgi:sugar transferase (PEP-CTERM/EpsH1 system associated)
MPAPIRILHVVDSLGKGGLENGLINLIERLDPDRFEHVVYAIRRLGEKASRLPGRVRVMCLGKKETDFPVHVAALVRGIREVGPAIVHSRNWAAIEAVVAGRWVRSCAVVHSEHGFESEASAPEPWRRTRFRRLAFELAHHVMAVSYQLRDFHAKRTGFPAPKITVIHNGVDSRRFHADPAARVRARGELGISPDEFCIGSVGNLYPVKDHVTLLRAVDGFASACKDWRLLVIGEGPEFAELETFVSAHREWRKRVSFLGSSNRVAELLNAMDVYVLPSVNEGICNSLLEAMATGLPVIATATGGNPEVVADGDSGLLFPVGNFRQLADQLLVLQAGRDLCTKLGQHALRRVREDFSIDSMVRKYEQLYESLAPVAIAPPRAAAGV